MRIAPQSNASVIGLRAPAANGAIVSGISAADMTLRKAFSVRDKANKDATRTSRKPNGSFHVPEICSISHDLIRQILRGETTNGSGTRAGSLAYVHIS